MELRINDYVRTKYGIAKIIDIGEITRICLSSDITYQDKQYILDVSIIPNYDTNCNYCYDYDIIKSSPNIIDLIEVGDYVNGHLVIKRHNDLMLEDTFDLVQDEDIKSIVTKESMESITYYVK